MKSEKLKAKRFGTSGVSIRYLRLVLYFSLFTFSFSLLSVLAQDDPPDTAPPPIKMLSKDERTKLDAEQDPKSRTKLAVDLMHDRVDIAEKLSAAGDFDGLFRELGGFRALLDYSLAFLQKQDPNVGKSLDNYKRIELSLRAAMPRLETIRRELPLRYEEYVRELLIYVRDARTRAIEPLYSNTVLPTEKSEK